ncbi:helix-turn-helix domain-containing protein [Natrialba sp. SSL1]|uniref:helix-turn-helix domain-containing protein n=1 Tax=Natrialba sp. SSL1 TaxID=1869245 RepID=UPI0008F8FCB8|nr:helix-turn-helix domain-containing protein [Natrialba sp. SSL1]OIB58164.1 transcriptional regulator [Natrialba sp. SSL1]
MRELVFALDYDPGQNTLADTLADFPDARVRSLSLHATVDSLWRVDHTTGSPDALSAIKDAFLTADYYADCLATEPCGAESETQILDQTDDTLVLYTYWQRTPVCVSIPHLALEHLGDGLLFETQHVQHRHTWRVIHPEDANIHGFFDALHAELSSDVDVEIVRLTGLSSSTTATFTAEEGTLTREQREALTAAAEHGYYETPRGIDLGELAEKLDVPRSTLTYRVRRAEAEIIKQFTDHDPVTDSVPTS